MRPREFRFINLFRALAALWVLVAHCRGWGGWYGIPLPSPKIAVDLFMMISGFLMAANAVARQDAEPVSTKAGRRAFWLRRFFRIAPAYYVALATVALLWPLLSQGIGALMAVQPSRWANSEVNPLDVQFTLDNLAMHVSFLFGLVPAYAASTTLPDWSLGLEMQFYFAFPFIVMAMGRFGTLRAVAVIGAAGVLLGLLVDHLVWYPEPSLLVLQLQYFLAGILLFHALHGSQASRVGMMACALVLVALESRFGQWRFVAAMLLLSMYGMGVMEREGNTPRALASLVEAARFPADVSYSVYLFHGMFIALFGVLLQRLPALQTLAPMPRTLLLLGFVLIGAYAVGWVVYRYVELPGIRLGRRLARRREGVGVADQVNVAVH